MPFCHRCLVQFLTNPWQGEHSKHKRDQTFALHMLQVERIELEKLKAVGLRNRVAALNEVRRDRQIVIVEMYHLVTSLGSV